MLCGHESPVETCQTCQRCASDPAFAAFARRVPSPRKAAPKASRFALPDCIHLGEPTGDMGQCSGCGSTHRTEPLRACPIHGVCSRDRPVKDIDGKRIACCRPGDCKERVEPAITGGIIVPQPPTLDLKPASRRAIVTVVVGDEAETCFAVSGPLMQRYAERLGADLVVLRWPGHPAWPISSKFQIPRVLEHYERIAYVDADVLLRPGCVDLFALCNPDEFGACDELPFHQARPRHGREIAYQQFRREMGFRDVPHPPWYLNAGVMVVPSCYRDLLLPPVSPIRVAHCSEQDHTNAMLLDSGARVRLLDRRANWQSWTDQGFRHAPPEAILHWSGSGGERARRSEAMRMKAMS